MLWEIVDQYVRACVRAFEKRGLRENITLELSWNDGGFISPGRGRNVDHTEVEGPRAG